MSATWPPLAELVPHAGPMRLLARVLEHDARTTRCEVVVADSALFQQADGSVPAWLAIEYMAQCIAVHAGLLARAGGAPRAGVLLGSRSVELGVERFAAGAVLQVEARHRRGSGGLESFDCRVEAGDGGAPLAQARLSVYTVEDLRELGEEA